MLPYVGSLQIPMTFFIIALFGVTFFLFIMVSGLVYFRLVYHSHLSGQTVPSLWVEIGPIGMAMSTLYTMLHLRKSGEGISFDLGWWSYVFPIGSFTSGTYALEKLTGSNFFAVASTVQLSILWICFIIVIWNTSSGIINGKLLKSRIPLSETRHLSLINK
ncbi:C4-dicarboxylate transporter/malic acid transport protein [Desulfosporosinus metallidurans]|uniref:C4-dicarboxylate transporter/malic acid transport protein n=1 Tax=Desulfosporosinus metallidurans TaxID=1888891 RepID=A0A1Q8QMN5_9FIRM|nr:C4-dicarboxylate transporter/malic acid transport protein [Desulfosporosinus metallidurans]